MRIPKKLLCALISALMVISAAVMPVSAANISKQPAAKSSSEKNYAEGEAIVMLRDNADSVYTSKSKAKSVYGSGITLKDTIKIDANGGDSVNMAVVKSSTLSTEQIISIVKKKSGVKYAFPNYIKKVSAITNDTYSKFQWALDNTGQQGGTPGVDVNADSLWDKAASAEKEAVVAVLDTGIDFNHEDLKDVIWTNPYGSKLVGTNGYDFTGTIDGCKPQDDNGHGSHIAGIIAGKADNSKGISGINKSNVKIMPLKFLTANGSGYSSSELSAFEYIARAIKLGTNIKAVNCSYDGIGDASEKKAYEEIFDELGKSGVITVVAAGNESMDLGNLDPDLYEKDEYILPASNDSKYCITVAASDENDKIAAFSNYSDKYVDVAAPGNDILSSVSYDCYNPSIYSEAQRNAVSKGYQNYNSGIAAGDFGYPDLSPVDSTDYHVLHDASADLSDVCFGESGKSMAVTFNEDASNDKDVYVIELPFTIDNPDEPYRISFMASCNVRIINGIAVDVPQSMACYYDGDYVTESCEIYTTKETWDHYELTIDPSKTENYLKSTERKLTIGLTAKKGDTFYIDDFAVSKQGVNTSQFGKYDFYSGTSMATPYVTGAVALVANSYPNANALDIVNMVCNTGRVVESYEGKVAGKHSMSLDNTDKTPPVISSAAYSTDGKNVEILGSINNASSVKVNSEAVTPLSVSADKVVIPDNNYNTKKIKIELTNDYGTGSFDTFLSNKPQIPTTTKVSGAPDSTLNLLTVMAGDKAYFVDALKGTVDRLSYKIAPNKYYYEYAGAIDLTKLSTEKANFAITSAAYYNGSIYFTAINQIMSSGYDVIGYDELLCAYDVSKKTTKTICEISNVPVCGATLTAYKGGLYIIGGFDFDERAFLDTVYKFNSTSNTFEELSAKLPEGRAETKFVVYGDKLVGMYGTEKSGKMPSPIVFDGTAWTKSSVVFDSDDSIYYMKSYDGNDYERYVGNVGIGENGVFCNGAFVYGFGDTFTYNPDTDTVTACNYCASNAPAGDKLFGITIPGCFIGFTADKNPSSGSDPEEYAKSSYDDDDDDDDDEDEDETTRTAYLLPLNNTSSDPAKQTYITLSKSSASLYVKGTVKIKATVRNPKGSTTYKSSNTKVAKVSSNGTITALKKGTAKITVKNNGVTRTFTVTVKNPKLNATSKTLKKGKTFTIKITGKIGKAKFVSSNKKVAAVSSSGKVTAKSKGTATITVTTNGIKLKCKIIVK